MKKEAANCPETQKGALPLAIVLSPSAIIAIVEAVTTTDRTPEQENIIHDIALIRKML